MCRESFCRRRGWTRVIPGGRACRDHRTPVVEPVETTEPRVVEPVETTGTRVVEPVETTGTRVVEPVETTGTGWSSWSSGGRARRDHRYRVVELVETTGTRVVELVETTGTRGDRACRDHT